MSKESMSLEAQSKSTIKFTVMKFKTANKTKFLLSSMNKLDSNSTLLKITLFIFLTLREINLGSGLLPIK